MVFQIMRFISLSLRFNIFLNPKPNRIKLKTMSLKRYEQQQKELFTAAADALTRSTFFIHFFPFSSLPSSSRMCTVAVTLLKFTFSFYLFMNHKLRVEHIVAIHSAFVRCTSSPSKTNSCKCLWTESLSSLCSCCVQECRFSF